MIERAVSEYMDAKAPTVRPETTTRDLVTLMAEERLGGVAVTDADGVLCGIVTAQDLLQLEVEADEHMPYAAPILGWVVFLQSVSDWDRHIEKAFAVTASDLMVTDVHTTAPTEPIHEAAKRMAEKRVSRLPVIDDGRVVGMFSRDDVVRALAELEFAGGDA